MRMQVKLEIGHKAACRLEPTPDGFTHDWTVFVRGSDGKDISHFIEKVIFHLHESFSKPKRAIKDPPYKLDESGYGGFELKIEVCFKTKDEPRRVNFTYDLFLPLSGLPPVTSVRTEALTFTHPTKDFMKKLVKGGGVPISAVNGISNGVSNGHPPLREESKEPMQKSASSISENEKTKKIKISKSTSKPNSAVVAMKRSSPAHEVSGTDGVPKKKKKSSEDSNSSKMKHSLGENLVMPVAQPLTTEVKDLKVKFKPIPPKKSAEKERKKELNSDSHKSKSTHASKAKESKSHKSEHESKKLNTSEHKIKVKKKGEKSDKKRGGEKKEKQKSKKDKIEKVTIRRGSGDSWASAGGVGLMSNVVAKNKALGKLLSELSSDEDEGDLSTPFKSESSPIMTKTSLKQNGDIPIPFKRAPSPVSTKPSLKERADLPTPIKHERSQALPRSSEKELISQKEEIFNKSSKTNLKNNQSNESNGHVGNYSNGDNAEEHLDQHGKSSQRTKHAIENRLSKDDVSKLRDNKLPSKELFDLYEKITKCEDSEFLQKVVDLIETTGHYTVAEKTFEFDLCCLERNTLKQLQKFLGIR